MRRAARVDENQQDVVDRLRSIGVQVEIIGLPLDLLICHRGSTELVEVKTEDGRLTKAQVEFIARWPGKIHIVRSADEAIASVLGKAMQ